MPELPEVEIVRRALDETVSGRKIIKAQLKREKLAPGFSRHSFSKSLSDTRINFVHRRGKHILVDLSNGLTLIVHLRMTGKFLLRDSADDDPKFAHAIFYLEDEEKLIFDDQRHFGFMNIVQTGALDQTKELRKLAPEPFSEEFSNRYFRRMLRSSRRSIKEVLLDQTKVCGLGNIYAAEAMFLARINPGTSADSVSAVKANRLHRRIIEVLRESIEYSEAIPVDPANLNGTYFGGAVDNSWRIYDRENKPCLNCKTAIRRIIQAGRSSYFCPKCQK